MKWTFNCMASGCHNKMELTPPLVCSYEDAMVTVKAQGWILLDRWICPKCIRDATREVFRPQGRLQPSVPWVCSCGNQDCCAIVYCKRGTTTVQEARAYLSSIGWRDTTDGWRCPRCVFDVDQSIRVYVSGPYSATDPETIQDRLWSAVEASVQLMIEGYEPFVPHTTCYLLSQPLHQAFSWDRWMMWCLTWLPMCQAVLQLPGSDRSQGATREADEAKRLGLPVFDTIAELKLKLPARKITEKEVHP